jgi:hypothetical protein
MSHIKGRNKYTLYQGLIRQRWTWIFGPVRTHVYMNRGGLGSRGWMSYRAGDKLMRRIEAEEQKLYGHRTF